MYWWVHAVFFVSAIFPSWLLYGCPPSVAITPSLSNLFYHTVPHMTLLSFSVFLLCILLLLHSIHNTYWQLQRWDSMTKIDGIGSSSTHTSNFYRFSLFSPIEHTSYGYNTFVQFHFAGVRHTWILFCCRHRRCGLYGNNIIFRIYFYDWILYIFTFSLISQFYVCFDDIT